MSHVSSVDLHIKDLDALARAADACGLELVRGQKTYRWYGRFLNDWRDPQRAAVMRGFNPNTFGHSEHALRLKNATGEDYEVGVVRRTDGQPGYALVFDVFGPGERLEQVAGVGLRNLKDQYAAAVARAQLMKKGYRVQTTRNAAGELVLTADRA